MPYLSKLISFTLALFLLLCISCTTTSAIAEESAINEPLTITFLAVGQADAILIQQGSLDMIVDTSRSYNDTLQSAMSQVSGSLEYLIITHPHYDHYGGAAGILKDHEVERVITNGRRRPSLVTWQRFEQAIEDEGLVVEVWEPNATFQLTEDLGIQILASGGDFPVDSGTNINDDSLVFMLHYQGRRILFTADIETSASQMLMDQHCITPSFCPDLRADVMKVPHHGSASFDESFFRAVDPFYGVVSAGHNVSYGNHCLPRRETVEFLSRQGVVLRSTNQGNGDQNVILTINPGGNMVWSSPQETNVFVWNTRTGENGFECDPQICETGFEFSCSPYNEENENE